MALARYTCLMLHALARRAVQSYFLVVIGRATLTAHKLKSPDLQAAVAMAADGIGSFCS